MDGRAVPSAQLRDIQCPCHAEGVIPYSKPRTAESYATLPVSRVIIDRHSAAAFDKRDPNWIS